MHLITAKDLKNIEKARLLRLRGLSWKEIAKKVRTSTFHLRELFRIARVDKKTYFFIVTCYSCDKIMGLCKAKPQHNTCCDACWGVDK